MDKLSEETTPGMATTSGFQGRIGDARLALAHCRRETALNDDEFSKVLPRLQMPMPRVALGKALRKIASAALDLSDGLLGDLTHILNASKVGATVNIDALPVSSILARQPEDFRMLCALGGGDDYEFVFHGPCIETQPRSGSIR